MGGMGSGSWRRCNTKRTNLDYPRMSTGDLNIRGRGIAICHSGSWKCLRYGEVRASVRYEVDIFSKPLGVRVEYDDPASGDHRNYKIGLTTTQPRYGGMRWWFICPAQGCGRRVGVLYLSNVFACRHCLNIAYHSQNEPRSCRFWKNMEKFYGSIPAG